MRRRFHALAGAAGALACGLVAVGWRLAAPPPYAATALVRVETDGAAHDADNLSVLRALAASDAVLRRAALAPEAAAAIAREARPGRFEALLALLSARPNQTDTLGRAADLLAARIAVEPSSDGARIVVRMDEGEAAVVVANAVAGATVVAHNEAAAKIDRRLDQSRRESLARAQSRRDAARERLASLRALDTTPIASIAPAVKAAPDPAELALAEAQRAALAAETRRAAAARIFGPRHPEMIQIGTAADRATAALRAARAKVATARHASRRPPAEGGPDPGLPELAHAQDEAERAEASYEREAARFAAPGRVARIVAPARAPASSGGEPASLVVGASALLGFVLFGSWPRARRSAAPPGAPDARLRNGALDRASARRMVEAMDIAASDGARRILVHGENARVAGEAAYALGLAALAAGWKPLIVDATHTGDANGVVTVDGLAFTTTPIPTRAGDLVVARPAGRSRARAPDVDLAFDLVLLGADAAATRVDIAIWIGAAPPHGRMRTSAAGPWIATA